MGRTKNITCIFISLLFSSCFSGRQSINGTYQFKGIYGVAYEIIISDSTFIYHWQNGLNKGTLIGTWKKQGDYLIMNSDNKPPNQKIKVEEVLKEGSFDSVYVKVMNFIGESLSYVVVTLNNEQSAITDLEGNAAIRNMIGVNTIKVSYLELAIPEYQVKNRATNRFTIKINTELDQEVYFDHVKGKMKGRRLILIGNPLSEGESMTLVKIKL